MAYADYTFYAGASYLGTAIAQADFPQLALRASAAIDRITFNRAAAIVTAATDTDTITKIKQATCAVAEEYQRLDAETGGGTGVIQSERVGNHSVTYVTSSAASKSNDAKLYDAARLYLEHTDLMYRGFNADE